MFGAIAVGSIAWAGVSTLIEPALRPGVALSPAQPQRWGDDQGRVNCCGSVVSLGCVDRSVEARIVQLDRELIAALARHFD